MVIIAPEQVKFMEPAPLTFSPSRFSLPATAAELFAHLAEFYTVCPPASVNSSPELTPEIQAKRLALVEKMEAYTAEFLRRHWTQSLPDSAILDSVRTRATEVLLELTQSVVGKQPVIDTLRTPTLAAYACDWDSTQKSAEEVRSYLQQQFQITAFGWQHDRDVLTADLEDTRCKSRLIEAIRLYFRLDDKQVSPTEQAKQFLCRLFPELVGAFSECHFVVSGTLFFFCLPGISEEDIVEPNEIQQDSVAPTHQGLAAFRARLHKFKQWQFSQFPMFGFLRGDEVDVEIIDKLADISGLAPSYIRCELGRVVGFLPYQFAERYLVHDIWGHGWQASMLRLEGLYQQLATFDQNFDWNCFVTLPDHTKLRLSDTIERTREGFELIPAKFGDFIQRWIWQRIPTAMTPLVAELVADLFEHKLFWTAPEIYNHLQTTSLLPTTPAKIDLMFDDLRIYFRQLFKALDLFCERQGYRQRFMVEMMTDGIDERSARAIVDQIQSLLVVWRKSDYASERVIFESDGEIKVNLYGILEHHIANLGVIASQVAQLAAQRATPQIGMQRWCDWLAISIAVYFEQDPLHHFWSLPNFIHQIASADIVGLSD